MNIEINNTTKAKINLSLVRGIVEKFLQKNNLKNSEVSIAFVGDTKIRRLNKEYRNIDKVTDILSFEGEGSYLGELIMDNNQIKRQAKKLGHSEKYELIFILVHGLFHLLGYNDNTEKDRLEMIRIGEEFIKTLNLKL